LGKNYIASAGTGKTYNLINDVLNAISEGVSFRDMLVLTFTEKAASELKEGISERIKYVLSSRCVPEEHKVKLHRELVFLESGYIGTFHSVFFRILKKYPQYTYVDGSFRILTGELDDFLEKTFERWVEEGFTGYSEWEEIVRLFSGKGESIKSTFLLFYKNRGRVGKIEADAGASRQKVEGYRTSVEKTLEEILEKYGKQLEELKNSAGSDIFRYDPEGLLSALHTGQVPYVKDDEGPTENKLFLIKKKKPKKGADIYKLLMEDGEFRKLDERLFHQLNSLQKEEKDLKVKLVFEAYRDFEDYVNRIKEEEKLLDFTDILIKTEELLSLNGNIRNELKGRFRYIFVDEFQDTDVIQTKILKHLDKGNIFIYGDPKQCIYTWRDANLDVYFRFIEEGGFEDVILDKNYRSDKRIVSFVNALLQEKGLLEHIEKKYRKPVQGTKELKNGGIERYILKAPEKPVDGIRYQGLLSLEIVEKLKGEGYSYRDIMVLFRKNSHLQTFKSIFLKAGIPVVSPGDDTFFKQPEVQTAIQVLRYVSNPDDRLELLKVLKSPFILATDEEVYRHKNNLENLLHSYIRESIIPKRRYLSLEEVVDLLYENTPLVETVCMLSENPFTPELLKKLKVLAKEKTGEGYSIQDFIRWSETASVPVPTPSGSDAVMFLTMHKAKGLESPVVIIPLLEGMGKKPSLNHNEGEVIIHGGKLLMYFPAKRAVSKDIELYREEILKDRENEEERLFYVAVTRPKERLIFVEMESEKRGRFSVMLDDLDRFLNGKYYVNPEDIKEKRNTQESKFSRNQLDKLLEKARENEKLLEELYSTASSKVRFTSVSKMMEKPETEAEEKAGDGTAVYTGILVHSVLEKMDFSRYSKKDVSGLVEDFRGKIPEEFRDKVLDEAKRILENIDFLISELKDARILFREMPFFMEKDGTVIEGRVDVVYRKDGVVYVMDYKTNRYTSRKELEKLLDIYRTQAEYYKEAVKRLFPEDRVVFRLAFLRTAELVDL